MYRAAVKTEEPLLLKKTPLRSFILSSAGRRPAKTQWASLQQHRSSTAVAPQCTWVTQDADLCVEAGTCPTIAAAAGNQHVRGRGLLRAGAEGVQAVEGVLAAVAWWREGVAALGVPAVDVAAVPDAAFGALCLLGLLKVRTRGLYPTHTCLQLSLSLYQ